MLTFGILKHCFFNFITVIYAYFLFIHGSMGYAQAPSLLH